MPFFVCLDAHLLRYIVAALELRLLLFGSLTPALTTLWQEAEIVAAKELMLTALCMRADCATIHCQHERRRRRRSCTFGHGNFRS